MNKLIIGIVAIAIVISVAMVAIFFTTDSGIILPDGGNDESGGDDIDSPEADITLAIPGDGYTVPKKDSWHSLHVEGSVYGTNVQSAVKVIVSWHNSIEYSKIEIPQSDYTGGDQYNAYWSTDMLIQRLGSGSHTLTAESVDVNGNVISSDSITINIPDYYIYTWDSNNPVRSDCAYYFTSFYGFTFPYQYNNEWYWLEGEIIRVKGDVYRSGFMPGYDHGAYNLWLDIWNGETGNWVVASDTVSVSSTAIGWLPVDVSVSNVWGNEVGFAGINNVDIIHGFKGEVWIKPGTPDYQISPLEIVAGIFNINAQNNPPCP